MFLFYVRHGQPDYGRDGLTEDGKKQAKAVAERFAFSGLDKIYSSTLGRAMETASYTAEKLALPIQGVDFAREDLTWAEFSTESEKGRVWAHDDPASVKKFLSADVAALGFKWYKSPLFKGTKFESGVKRVKEAVDGFLKELGYVRDSATGLISAERHVYDRVALFAHAGFSVSFMSDLLHIPYPVFCTRFFGCGVSSVTAFKFPDEGEGFIPKTYTFGNDSHLYKENLLDTYDIRAF